MVKKTKSLLILLLAIAVFASSAYANGANETNDNAPIELVYWSHYGQSPAFVQSFADAVNLAAKNLGYDNVTCRAEVIEYSGYEAKYITGFSSANGPDFFLGRPSDWAIDGGVNPIAVPFNDDVADAWNNALAPIYKSAGMFNGKVYGFAAEGGTFQMLYINTDAMAEAGLTEKDIPKTVSEFEVFVEKLTKRDANGKIIRSGYQPRYLGGGDGVGGKTLTWFHDFGARVLSPDLTKANGYVNSDKAIKAMTWYQNLINKVSNLEFGSPETAFQQGQSATITREGWYAQDTIDKAPNIHFIVVPFPGGDEPENDILASPSGGGWVNMISGKSKHIDLCQKIVKELAKEEYDVILHEAAGYPPVLKETMTMDNAYFSKLPYAQATIDSSNKKDGPNYERIKQWGAIAIGYGDAVAAIVGGADVKTTLDNLAVNADQILAQN